MSEKILKYKKFVCCYGRTDGQQNGRTEEKADITKFLVAFRHFVNASNRMVHKSEKYLYILCFSSNISTLKMQAKYVLR